MECLLTPHDLEAARAVVAASSLGVRRTPCLLVRGGQPGEACTILPELSTAHGWDRVYLKLENLQATGSFKLRGVANQFAGLKPGGGPLVTMSAGNYGRSFATAARALGVPATVLLPDTAPGPRRALLQGLGAAVERCPAAELMAGVERHVAAGATFLHPFDCRQLIAGHASLGLELAEQVAGLDTVLVCCGGGGLLAGVAAGLAFAKPGVRVVGVEPEAANTMHRSLAEGRPAALPSAHSRAAGLAPPFAGSNAYRHVAKHGAGVVLVSEAEILAATLALHRSGLVVEPSGAAGLAALLAGKVDAMGRGGSLVIVLTGGNVTPAELACMEQEELAGLEQFGHG